MSTQRENAREFMERLWKPVLAPQRPRRYTGPPADALILGTDPATGQAVYFLPEDLMVGLHVIGGPGGGKTWGIRRFCAELLRLKHRLGWGFTYIDPHGSGVRAVRDFIASEYPEFADEFLYMDLAQLSKVVALNPTAKATLENGHLVATSYAESIIKACGAKTSADLPSVTSFLVHLFETLAYAGVSLPDAEFFLFRSPQYHAVFRALLERVPEIGPTRAARAYFEHFDTLTKSSQEALTVGPINRLSRLTRPKEFRRLLTPQVSIDPLAVMDSGGILLIDLSAPPGTNVSADGRNMLAGLIVQAFNLAWPNRTPDKARPHILILDEAADYISGDMARLTTGARKFQLGTVYAHQGLSQVVGRDGDEALLHTLLAIPNRMAFGRMFLDEALVVAKQMHLAALNPDAVKHIVKSVCWDPVPTKVKLRSETRGETSTEGGQDADTHGGSQNRSSRSIESEASSWSRLSAHNFSHSHSFSESDTEAWVTFYRKRIAEGAVTFQSIDEQVFRCAQRMILAPVGHAAVARMNEIPRTCRINPVPDLNLSPRELAGFLERVHSGRNGHLFLDPADLDRCLEEHERELLALAEPQIASSKGFSKSRRASRRECVDLEAEPV